MCGAQSHAAEARISPASLHVPAVFPRAPRWANQRVRCGKEAGFLRPGRGEEEDACYRDKRAVWKLNWRGGFVSGGVFVAGWLSEISIDVGEHGEFGEKIRVDRML